MTFLERTLLGTVMILAVAVLRALALRRLPKGTFVALWQLTVLRLLVPAELPSRFSVYTMLEALRPKAVPVPPAAPAVTPYVPAPAAALPGPSGMMPAAPAPFPVWTALWLTGAAALGLWHLVRYVRWRRRFRESLPAGDCPAADACLRSRREARLCLPSPAAGRRCGGPAFTSARCGWQGDRAIWRCPSPAPKTGRKPSETVKIPGCMSA